MLWQSVVNGGTSQKQTQEIEVKKEISNKKLSNLVLTHELHFQVPCIETKRRLSFVIKSTSRMKQEPTKKHRLKHIKANINFTTE